ncbi:hypothetical protein FIBSPDRAFT_762875 [Athelia psychrophila]|uniref:Integrase catalytic domain-containing protein n=1 Tax=Athelia psychrophila TaxID=1759441 RepID=A0A167XQI9_9AGAM|nr:hypothetical protein FIBSPDRAFT_762875 [Fibularhizoctonia sp. CBS 109695]
MEESESAPSTSTARNPTGKNQYTDCSPKGDGRTQQLLTSYHRRGITNRNTISDLLRQESPSIIMSSTSVGQRLRMLGLFASGATMKGLPETAKRQLVLDEIGKDPLGKLGPRTVKDNIRDETGIHLMRDYIATEMLAHNHTGFDAREPGAKKIHRTPLVSLGPHHEWSGDEHNKLAAIGFPIWALRDVWSLCWLGIWVVPNNQLKNVIAYLYLSLIYELGGFPLQSTTDCGSETTDMYGFANTLRELFAPHLPIDELPAHRFLKSVHNITIERGWLRLRIQWGNNVKVFWAGAGIYNASDPQQYELVQYLWSTLIQQELDTLKERFNNHTVRKDKDKKLPSGTSPWSAYTLHESYGGQNCLQPVDREFVKSVMEDLDGEDLIRFVSVEYAARAADVMEIVGLGKLTFHNVWLVFSAMMPIPYPK